MNWKHRIPASATIVALAASTAIAVSCNGSDRGKDSAVPNANAASASDRSATDTSSLSLANAAGRSAYVEKSGIATGSVTGIVQSSEKPGDTTVVPALDQLACPKFTRPLYPSNGGVGNAVVWLAGVASGRANDLPRRVTITLDQCELVPHVDRIAAGGTLIVSSRDKVMWKLRFVAADTARARDVLATVALNDAGQVVPLSDATDAPGLVAIRDELHPWVSGYLAVAPHPFVVVTQPDGRFVFTDVPAGTYTLVTWHERFGITSRSVTVEAGKEATAEVRVQ